MSVRESYEVLEVRKWGLIRLFLSTLVRKWQPMEVVKGSDTQFSLYRVTSVWLVSPNTSARERKKKSRRYKLS